MGGLFLLAGRARYCASASAGTAYVGQPGARAAEPGPVAENLAQNGQRESIPVGAGGQCGAQGESNGAHENPHKASKKQRSRAVTTGGGGIRTPDTVSRVTVFKTVAFSHSATPPSIRFSSVRYRRSARQDAQRRVAILPGSAARSPKSNHAAWDNKAGRSFAANIQRRLRGFQTPTGRL